MINEIIFFCKNVKKLFSLNFHSECGKNVYGGLSECHTGLRFCWDSGVDSTVVCVQQPFSVQVKSSSRGLNLLSSSKNMYRTFYIKRNIIPYEFVLHFLKCCFRSQAMVGLTNQKSLLTV